MIVSKTPFRISFFGGGTDYPAWSRENGGAVLGTTIDKYCYISVRRLPPFFNYKYRVAYSKIETVSAIDDIVHPSVRETLRWSKIEEGLEIHHDGDLPARSGLGSSSSFTVGLINALNAFRSRATSDGELAQTAIMLEQDVMKEAVGSQDQILASYGGLNHIVFRTDETYDLNPVIAPKERIVWLQDHLMLFFTGVSRFSTEIAKTKIDNFKNKGAELRAIGQMVDHAIGIVSSPTTPVTEFGRLLHESWKLKRDLSTSVTNSTIDDIYDIALRAGAVGGKLLGAGGGGFMLLFAEPPTQGRIRKALAPLIEVPFRFERSGSKIALYQPNGL
jgi:D-glycero-alpha-D-manno-heptose-7-phosphate kinase